MGVRAFPLVGRVEELQRVRQALASADSGGVVIAGVQGVGKTRLAREAVAALGAGVAVEWSAATPGAASIPFGALAHLVPDLDVASPDDHLRLLRGILATLGQRAGQPDQPGKPRKAGPPHGAGSRLVLAVDDAQWLDPAAAALVHQLVVTGADRVLLTMRTGDRAADPVVGLWKDGLVDRFELQPLRPRELEALVLAGLDRPVDRDTLARFWALSHGNPLFARELVLGALETGAFSESDGVWRWTGGYGPSTRLSLVLQDRLGRASTAGRSVLDHLALGEPLGLDTLTALCGTAAVAEVEKAGLVAADGDGDEAEVRLSHPLYGEALRADLPRAERRRVTIRLADALERATPASPAHLLRVARCGWRAGARAPSGCSPRPPRWRTPPMITPSPSAWPDARSPRAVVSGPRSRWASP